MQESSLKGKNLLLVNGCSPSKAFIFEQIKETGANIICLHSEKGSWIEAYVDERIIADVYKHEEALKALDIFMIANSHISIDGAITFWEESVLLTAKIVDKYHLKGIPYDIAVHLKNKYLLRKNYNQGKAKSLIISSVKDLELIDKDLGYPAVIKPVFGAASSNVVKVLNYEDAVEKYNSIVGKIKNDEYVKDGRDIIAESYISGKEVDMDIVMQDGHIKFFSITDNDQPTEPYFLEAGQNIPTRLPHDAQDKLQALSLKIIEDAGITDACLHFEAKYTGSTVEIIETNLRMGGAWVHSFLSNARGVNLIKESAKVALGVECLIDKSSVPLCYLVGKHLLPDKSGIIKCINIPEAIYKDPRLLEIKILTKVGEEILTPPEGFGDHGWITVKGSTPEEADQAMEELYPQIQIEIE